MISTWSVMASDRGGGGEFKCQHQKLMCVCMWVFVLYIRERETARQQRQYQEPRIVKRLITAAEEAFKKNLMRVEWYCIQQVQLVLLLSLQLSLNGQFESEQMC